MNRTLETFRSIVTRVVPWWLSPGLLTGYWEASPSRRILGAVQNVAGSVLRYAADFAEDVDRDLSYPRRPDHDEIDRMVKRCRDASRAQAHPEQTDTGPIERGRCSFLWAFEAGDCIGVPVLMVDGEPRVRLDTGAPVYRDSFAAWSEDRERD